MPLHSTLGVKLGIMTNARKGEMVCVFVLEGYKSVMVLDPSEAMSEGPWEVFKVTVWNLAANYCIGAGEWFACIQVFVHACVYVRCMCSCMCLTVCCAPMYVPWRPEVNIGMSSSITLDLIYLFIHLSIYISINLFIYLQNFFTEQETCP